MVIRRIAGTSETSLPRCHVPASARERSRMMVPYARIRSPWKGGLISLRSRRWRSPARRMSECLPRSGSTGLTWSGSKASGGAEKISRAPSGWPVISTSPTEGIWTTNGSPRRAAQRWKKPSGSNAMPSAWSTTGRRERGSAQLTSFRRPAAP